tara:strand:+ start:484 stop:732 length:249 start_codon:yes stop_codon:yes gene_type:complete
MKKILYFSAAWCGPCKQLGPVVTKLQSEGINIQKIDVDTDPNSSAKYSIRSIPTLVVVNTEGMELSRSTGFKSEQEIKNMLN